MDQKTLNPVNLIFFSKMNNSDNFTRFNRKSPILLLQYRINGEYDNTKSNLYFIYKKKQLLILLILIVFLYSEFHSKKDYQSLEE